MCTRDLGRNLAPVRAIKTEHDVKKEHVCVYDVNVLFFYKNSLDFKFNLVQSKDEMENDIRIGFSCSTVQQQNL